MFVLASIKRTPVLKTTNYFFKGAHEIRELNDIVFFDMLNCVIHPKMPLIVGHFSYLQIRNTIKKYSSRY